MIWNYIKLSEDEETDSPGDRQKKSCNTGGARKTGNDLQIPYAGIFWMI